MLMEVLQTVSSIIFFFLHMVNYFRCLFVAQTLYISDNQHKQHSVSGK